jgi:DNA-binding NarL/FixJ family response regulator
VAGRRISVLILYMHPLLGQGLARLLAAEPGLDITSTSAHEAVEARSALASGTQIVIVERGVPIEIADLLRAARDALVIDVSMDPGPSWRLERDEIQSRPEELLRAIRRFRQVERARSAAGTAGSR